MGMDQYGGRQSVKSEINVTPLVDVCLVLLIIFMVVTPMLQKGRPVLLPQTERPEKKPESQNELLISVEVDKNIFIDTKWYPDRDFQAKIKEQYERNPAKDVIIKADNRLTYGDVKKVMRFVKEGGYEKVGLITEKRGQK
ncbi:biopolymer transporter ExbD [Acidobacteria bacterium ACD]|nr:MAG: biopolymer transporter ExbD [Acidobacteriota bacterium]MCE7959283.1 biopolymer transporter ExbD [Acidobacteria bacterium ACB2]MDL1949845.1 biopolymer transporter ExbD [Acidobacteria bacterium ACD]